MPSIQVVPLELVAAALRLDAAALRLLEAGRDAVVACRAVGAELASVPHADEARTARLARALDARVDELGTMLCERASLLRRAADRYVAADTSTTSGAGKP